VTFRLGTILSHPTQYHSPWFRELACRPEIALEVLYCFRPTPMQQGAGFGVPFEWDIDLLDGYEYRFLKNVSKRRLSCQRLECAQLLAGDARMLGKTDTIDSPGRLTPPESVACYKAIREAHRIW
jgi:hypothetical protein